MNNENNFITYLITTITRSWGDQSLDSTDKPSDTQTNKDTEQ
jgi:hypothetical protein